MSQKQLEHFNCYHYTNILTSEDIEEIENDLANPVTNPIANPVTKEVTKKLSKLTMENQNNVS